MTYSLMQLAEEGAPRLAPRIERPDEWAPLRASILSTWMEVMGGLPEREPVSYEILSETKAAGHRRLHLKYRVAHDDYVTAFLLIPEEAERNGQRLPAVLALHPTSDNGKEDVATESGRENRRYGLELAARGYVVLAPDTITSGERVYPGEQPFRTAPFYEKHPQWSAVGKMLSDHMQGVDLLCSLDFVDPQRIGAIGHSLGGYNAIFLAGVDPRIRAVVSSCGFSVFAGDPDPNRWGKRDWFSHLPALTPGIHHGSIPFDFNEIAALAAPTPQFVWCGQRDTIFPHWRPISNAMEDLHELYEKLGATGRLRFILGNEGHDFPADIRELAYRFLNKWLVEP